MILLLDFSGLEHFLIWQNESLLRGQNFLLADLSSKLLKFLALFALQSCQFLVKVVSHLLQLPLKRCMEL